MTDDQWRACADPDEMLVAVQGVATDRQLRQWCCACVRRVWDQFAHAEVGRRAVMVAEAFARDTANISDLEQACQDAEAAIPVAPNYRVKDALRAASWCAAEAIDALGVARSVGWGATYAAVGREDVVQASVERAAQAELLRQVLGMGSGKE